MYEIMYPLVSMAPSILVSIAGSPQGWLTRGPGLPLAPRNSSSHKAKPSTIIMPLKQPSIKLHGPGGFQMPLFHRFFSLRWKLLALLLVWHTGLEIRAGHAFTPVREEASNGGRKPGGAPSLGQWSEGCDNGEQRAPDGDRCERNATRENKGFADNSALKEEHDRKPGRPLSGQVAASFGGMIVSAEAHATQVGLEVFDRGGNAIDAAIAVAYVLAVTHPSAGNLGGGGFLIVAMADGRRGAIDYREVAPLSAHRQMYLDDTGQLVSQRATLGGLAAGIPGTVAGLELARKTFGTLAHRELVMPAVQLARKGHRLDEAHARSLAQAMEKMRSFPSSMAIFSKAGQPYAPGDLLVQPDLAGTLQILADQGPRALYEGRLAQRFVEGAKEVGAIWTLEDLAAYRPKLRTPLELGYGRWKIVSMPPPSSGGIVLFQMLQASKVVGMSHTQAYSADEIHLYAKIARRMYADRNEWIADPDRVFVPVEGLLDLDYLRMRLQGGALSRATPSGAVGFGIPPGAVPGLRPWEIAPNSKTDHLPVPPGTPESEETTHFSVIDRWGNAVSNTYTLNLAFGSKAVAVGTGILLNNEMDDFATKPGTANSFGLVQGERNAVGPGKRMLSSMTPTIVLEGNKVRLVVGSPGGSTIITTVFQILRHVLDRGWKLERAVLAPRIHHQGLPDEISAERQALSPETIHSLEQRGHKILFRRPIGAANCIEVELESGLRIGIVDPRGGGLAAGQVN